MNDVTWANLMHGILGDAWRTNRRAAHEILTPNACESYLPIQYAEASQMMYEFLTKPQVNFSLMRTSPR